MNPTKKQVKKPEKQHRRRSLVARFTSQYTQLRTQESNLVEQIIAAAHKEDKNIKEKLEATRKQRRDLEKLLFPRLLERLGSTSNGSIESFASTNHNNSKQIASDSLCLVFSYLNAADWRVSHQWRVCRWWYYTMRNSTSLRLRSMLPANRGGRSFLTSSLGHHFTEIGLRGSTSQVALLSARTNLTCSIELVRLSSLTYSCNLSPLLSLSQLHKLSIIDSGELEIAQLRVIKQLPALKTFVRLESDRDRFFPSPWTNEELIEVTKQPTRCSQWTYLELGGTEDTLSRRAISSIVQFTGLTSLDFHYQIDYDGGVIPHLSHLETLSIAPCYADPELDGDRTRPIDSLTHIGTTLARCHTLRELFLKLVDFFQNPVMKAQADAQGEEPYVPSVTNATQLLNAALSQSTSSSFHQLHISYAYALTDLSFLSSLHHLRELTFTRCWSLTPTSLLQIVSSLNQLELLQIAFQFDDMINRCRSEDEEEGGIDRTHIYSALHAEFEFRYQQLDAMRPQLTPPSSLMPSLRTFTLRFK